MARVIALPAAVGLVLLAAQAAQAHAPVFDCYKDAQQVVCEAGFSDGSSAAGRKVRVKDDNDRVIQEGEIDTAGQFRFTPPPQHYHVDFEGGGEHKASMDSGDIT